ncbi:hypothetical protein POTOM_038379 [Populus tomentosa]|uniref:Uncharacterized protein n=1 Tax=Populus tomentosa TaxID=118781 RepID=A0A8X8CDE4_POPTO|nr:hypothetical protein POTOM_038379 [Populus tomentosa]
MEEEKSLSLASYKTDGDNMGMVLMLASMVLSWMFIHRWNQRHKKGIVNEDDSRVEIGTLAPNLQPIALLSHLILLTSSRKTETEEARGTGKSTKIKHDILSRFIELGEDPESYLTDKSLRDVVLDFVIAGRDTTATTLSWAIYTIMTRSREALL